MLISKWMIELGRRIEKADMGVTYYVCISNEQGLFLCKPADNPKVNDKFKHETLARFTSEKLKKGLTFKEWARIEDAARIRVKEMGLETYGHKKAR